ncbi:MAG: response regulator transcription factor [Silicimonas sp.]|nr:response regulator transcription factor [Silicimonas sp.]
MKTLVYLLEDDTDVAKLIDRTLSQQGLEVVCLRKLSEFEVALKRRTPDLCLIDLSLPDGDGLSMLSAKGPLGAIPKIVVTGRGNVTDRVVGLEVGADDYVVKPFEPRELVARVRAVLRRAETPGQGAEASLRRQVRFEEWQADFDACTLTHADGAVESLSSSEAELLLAFVRAAGRVLSRDQLLDATVGHHDSPFDRSMDARISRLRKKLRDDPKTPKIIRTVYGAGYVFSSDVIED